MVRKIIAIVAVFIAAYACRPAGGLSDPFADDATRVVIGMDHPYKARQFSEADVSALNHDYAKRRLLGWQIMQQIFTPVMIENGKGEQKPVALWQTWFSSDEIEKMFQELYQHLPQENRYKVGLDRPKAIQPVDDRLLDCVLNDYLSEARLKERYGKTLFNKMIRERISQLRERDVKSLNGVAAGATLFNLATVRHYLKNYAKVIECTKETVASSDKAVFAPCFFDEFPKDAVSVKAIWARDDEDIEMFDTSAAGIERAVTGPATWVSSCGEPGGCKIAAGDPALDGKMYSANIQHPDGSFNKFRLTGMHVVTKEVREWIWMSMFWSHKPETDFGEDRPDWLGDHGKHKFSELQHYKMCIATDFTERDPKILQQIPQYRQHPETFKKTGLLAATLSSLVHGDSGIEGIDPLVVPKSVNSWCSNPYVEKDPGMADANCIGCHQGAGPDGDMEFVRHKKYDQFPADYAFSYEFYLDLISKNNDNIKSKFADNAKNLFGSAVKTCRSK